MSIVGDIDIDLPDRTELLKLIPYISASRYSNGELAAHNTGVYVTAIPHDAGNNRATIDYIEAENRGYFKLDLLNVYVYKHVRDHAHLTELMQEPDWSMLKNRRRVENLIHLNNSWHIMKKMPEPITSIPRLAMFLAIIRPGKKHLIGLPWAEVAKTVWDKDVEGYIFKKSHSISYAHLIVIHMNLFSEGVLSDSTNQSNTSAF